VKSCSLPLVAFCVFGLCLATTAFAATCPGGPVTVDLTSPAGSGTYSVPVYFAATASSTAGTISGYAVYTNQWSYIPFAEGEPIYRNNDITTLNAYVILPETQSGGSLAQTVFVRAWDSAGNCGDSANLSITASGANIPSSFSGLGGVQTWTNTENDEENSDDGNVAGWWACSSCAGTGPVGTVSYTFDQTSPEYGSNPSIEFTLTGASGSDGLFYYKVPPYGEQDSLTNFVWDFYFYLSENDTKANTAALEFDLFQAVDGYKYMIGTQCNYYQSGISTPIWNTWNATAGNWEPAVRNSETDSSPPPSASNGIACPNPITTQGWHHLQYYLQRTYPDSTYPEGRILYGTMALDGQATVWNISAPPVATSWGDVLGIQQQQDIQTGTVTLQEWVDENDLTSWPQD
jgi:hypothetical protein